ncbi:MAG: hypothetical protein OES32_10560 [Acidobacteriota bacterium]|nr:hypothetical protein [Acidobacteriota bacterium]MDH3524017.1 hypothetical protein [Acidobacteriota bacterium]
MSSRRLMSRLYYFTIEDESMLAEAFPQFEEEGIAVTYKVVDTDDVFVTTADTREAMDRHDVPYNLLAEEDAERVSIYHTALSREELGEHEDPLKALALAYRAIAIACVGVNGETDLGFDLSEGTEGYTYFTAPAGHTFIWRLFRSREEAEEFLRKLTGEDKEALAWARAIPLASADELTGYH